MAPDTAGQEELLRLLLDYEEKHGEKGGWLLIALGLVYLGQMVRLIEQRAALMPVTPAAKDPAAGTGGGLGDLLGLLGPLMSTFKSSPSRSAPEAAPPAEPPPEETRPEELRPVRNTEVIKWDPRLVGGARK